MFDVCRKVKTLLAADPKLAKEYEPQIYLGNKTIWNIAAALGGREGGAVRRDGKHPPEYFISDWIRQAAKPWTQYWPKIAKRTEQNALVDEFCEGVLAKLPAETLPKIEGYLKQLRKG
jgi:hypothetical protein